MLIFYLDLTKRSFSVVCWSWNRSRVLAWNVAVLFCATHSSSSSNNIQDEYQISTDFLWSARNIVLTARVHKVKTTSKTHHPNHDCRFHFPNFDQLPGQINKQIHTYMETRKRSPRKKTFACELFSVRWGNRRGRPPRRTKEVIRMTLFALIVASYFALEQTSPQ